MTDNQKPQYVVLRVADRKILYCGNSITHAATCLDPGTVYGASNMHGLAMAEAERKAKEAEKNAKRVV